MIKQELSHGFYKQQKRLPKQKWGYAFWPKSQGGYIILCFIAFLLTIFLFAWGPYVTTLTPSSPVCML
jgi:hypothetical protein